jgi:hypothetical protein
MSDRTVLQPSRRSADSSGFAMSMARRSHSVCIARHAAACDYHQQRRRQQQGKQEQRLERTFIMPGSNAA